MLSPHAVLPLRKQKRRILKFAHPGGVLSSLIPKVRRQQDMEVITGKCALLRDKMDML